MAWKQVRVLRDPAMLVPSYGFLYLGRLPGSLSQDLTWNSFCLLTPGEHRMYFVLRLISLHMCALLSPGLGSMAFASGASLAIE